jgi:hypothetical protein
MRGSEAGTTKSRKNSADMRIYSKDVRSELGSRGLGLPNIKDIGKNPREAYNSGTEFAVHDPRVGRPVGPME